MSNTIAEKIRQLRVIRGLSQENVADEIPMSHGNYGKIERGEVDINSSRLIRLAKILKVNVGDFFDDKISIAKEPKSEYGFATKEELSDVMHAIIKLTKAVERMEEQLPKKKVVVKKVSKKK